MEVTWLGCAGFAVRAGGRTLLLDPFATRSSLRKVALGAKLRPDRAAIDRWLPRADYVVCGHAHYDHALDAPAVALRDRAILAGSETLCRIARASGLPASQLREVGPAGATLELQPFTVRLVPGLHGRWAFGRMLFSGCLHEEPVLPMRASGWVDGGVFGIHVEAEGASLFHQGSAGVLDGPLRGLRTDVLLACLAGRRFTPGYLERLIGPLQPRLVVASHFDDFFRPIDARLRVLPGTGLRSFPREVRALGPEPLVPAHLERFNVG